MEYSDVVLDNIKKLSQQLKCELWQAALIYEVSFIEKDVDKIADILEY